MKKAYLVLLIGFHFVVTAQTVSKLDNTKISFASLDKKIDSLVKAGQVHGLAVAIFNNNEPVYKKNLWL
jgi:hypothetical protein